MALERTASELYRQWQLHRLTSTETAERLQIGVNEFVTLLTLGDYDEVLVCLPPVGKAAGNIYTIIVDSLSGSGTAWVVPYGTSVYSTPTDGDDALFGSTVGAGVAFATVNDRCAVYSDGLHWYVISSMLT